MTIDTYLKEKAYDIINFCENKLKLSVKNVQRMTTLLSDVAYGCAIKNSFNFEDPNIAFVEFAIGAGGIVANHTYNRQNNAEKGTVAYDIKDGVDKRLRYMNMVFTGTMAVGSIVSKLDQLNDNTAEGLGYLALGTGLFLVKQYIEAREPRN